MSIEIDKFLIKKDNAIVTFPIDGSGAQAAMVSGFDENENIRLVKVTSDGKLMVDANVSVGSINIGDVNIRALDNSLAPQNLSAYQNPDLSWSLKVKITDDIINGLIFGWDGSSNKKISVDDTGKLNVNVLSSIDQTIVSKESIGSTPAPFNTGDIYADLIIINCRRYKDKTILVNNTSTNSAIISVLASIDNGMTYDIKLETDKELPGDSQYVINDSNIYTHIKIIAKSKISGQSATLNAKFYLLS